VLTVRTFSMMSSPPVIITLELTSRHLACIGSLAKFRDAKHASLLGGMV
jgi:hypothetical protein